MPMILKLMGLYLFNLAGLYGLIILLMRSGRTWGEALRVAWETIMAGNGENCPHGPINSNLTVILAKTWWMMIFITLLLWFLEPAPGYGYALLGLGLIHLGWYGRSISSMTRDHERIEALDSEWGIIHLTVRESSFFNAKSLAELDLRKKNLLILAIVRMGKIIPFPKGVEILMSGDRLVIFGDSGYYREIKS